MAVSSGEPVRGVAAAEAAQNALMVQFAKPQSCSEPPIAQTLKSSRLVEVEVHVDRVRIADGVIPRELHAEAGRADDERVLARLRHTPDGLVVRDEVVTRLLGRVEIGRRRPRGRAGRDARRAGDRPRLAAGIGVGAELAGTVRQVDVREREIRNRVTHGHVVLVALVDVVGVVAADARAPRADLAALLDTGRAAGRRDVLVIALEARVLGRPGCRGSPRRPCRCSCRRCRCATGRRARSGRTGCSRCDRRSTRWPTTSATSCARRTRRCRRASRSCCCRRCRRGCSCSRPRRGRR